VLCRTGSCAVSIFGRKSLGVGGSVLLMQGRVGLDCWERVITVFSGVGRLGLRAGREGVETLVWILSGEGGGAGLGTGASNGLIAEYVVDGKGNVKV
jgi:hypothetical protein